MSNTKKDNRVQHEHLPDGWSLLEFSDFVDLSKAKYIPNSNEHLRCLELENLESGTGQILGWSDSAEQISTKNKFAKGQTLFGKLRPYLRKYWEAQFDGVCSSEIWVFSSKSVTNCLPRFLPCLIQQSRFMQVANVSSGSKMPRADWDYVSSFPFLLPPLAEQKAIARVLGTMDELISKTSRLIEQKKLRKKYLMQTLLTGKKRLPGFTGEWKEVRLSDLFERVTRRNKDGCTNVVTISAQRGFVRQTDFFNKTIASETVDNYFLVRRGEFCYNKSYSNGYAWGATKRLNDFDEAVVTTLYICFGLKDSKNNSGDFFEHFFEANRLDHGLMRIAHEGGRAHGLLNVTPSDFLELMILIPDHDEQKAISKVLSLAAWQIALLETKSVLLKMQKKWLMQQLLTGRKRLKV